ncbi:MAG TPA: porin [Candidatus Brocadiia bacterium]|nr:porin [Candidatus Brocadiia bacterium]
MKRVVNVVISVVWCLTIFPAFVGAAADETVALSREEAGDTNADAKDDTKQELYELKKEVADLREEVDELKKDKADEKKTGELDVFWKDGLKIKSTDGAFDISLGLLVQNDWVFIDEDSETKKRIGDQEDGVEFRRIRFDSLGTIYERYEYKAMVEVAGGDAKLHDMCVAVRQIPVIGHVQVGHFKEPFGLDYMIPCKYDTFMEKSLPSVLAPGRNVGAQVGDCYVEDRITWALGVFRETDDYGRGTREGGMNATGRLTCLPLYGEEGRRLVHLGMGASYRDPDSVSYSQRPECHLVDKYVKTSVSDVDREFLVGPETAAVLGPLSLQSELFAARCDVSDKGNADFWGWYAQAGYFLTGENKAYNKKSAFFVRTKPKKNFLDEDGIGAWEVAARYAYLDLSDEEVKSGGEMQDVTLGLNWHLNPNIVVSWNYIRAHLEDIGDTDIFAMRLQVEF